MFLQSTQDFFILSNTNLILNLGEINKQVSMWRKLEDNNIILKIRTYKTHFLKSTIIFIVYQNPWAWVWQVMKRMKSLLQSSGEKMETDLINQFTFYFSSSITSPMEEGTPTAPLNISNSPSTNILGKNYLRQRIQLGLTLY